MPFDEPQDKKGTDKRIIIVIVVLAVIGAFVLFGLPLLYRFGFFDIPGFGARDHMQMLVIGQPSVALLADLDIQNDLVYYRVKDASSLDVAAKNQLSKYDVVLLDQHLGLTPYDKSISRTLGEALENYVKTGGKLVVIMDSGIYRSGGIYGTGVASDVVGWKATFGDIMPVECDLAQSGIPTCREQIAVSGKIHRIDFDHKIMEGIEVAPADPRYGPLSLITFNVKPTGNLVSQIKHVATASNFPGIVEKRLLIGKLLYFNYDPAVTPGIWQNTLEYLR